MTEHPSPLAPAGPPVRIERDSAGDVSVPADRLWGAQTQRALEHFRISSERWAPELVAQRSEAAVRGLLRARGDATLLNELACLTRTRCASPAR